MEEMISYLDDIGHAFGVGGFEGVIGALVITLAALVIVVRSLSSLRRTGNKIQVEEAKVDPLKWMEDAEKSLGCDQESKNSDPSWAILNGNSYHNIRYRRDT